jgi:hypothetical protein
MTQGSGAQGSGAQGSQQPGESGQAHAVRFIFEYEDDEVRLVSQRRVDVAVTGFDLPSRQGMPPGNYVEMRDAEGAALADVPIREDMSRSLEVFPEAPGAPITRTELPHARGAFTVVAPAPDGVREVAVVRVAPTRAVPERGAAAPAPGEGAPAVAATDLATFAFEPQD